MSLVRVLRRGQRRYSTAERPNVVSPSRWEELIRALVAKHRRATFLFLSHECALLVQ